MALYRFSLLKYPLKVNDGMSKLKYAIIISIWIIIFLFWTINYIPSYNEGCGVIDLYALRLSIVILFYIMPLFIIITSNILTIHELRKRNKIKQAKGLGHHVAAPGTVIHTHKNHHHVEETIIHNSHGNHEGHHDINSIKETDPHKFRKAFLKAIKPYICLFIVSITMIICFTPYTTMSFLPEWGKNDIDSIFGTMTYFIGVVNPITIIIFQDSFRHEFERYFCCKKQH